MPNTPFFSYDIDSLSFLERAEEQLTQFDETENVSCLLYAALELRMGIEAKLHESLDAAKGKQRKSQAGYSAKKLFAEFLDARPDAQEESFFIMGRVGSKERMGFMYSPITRTLAEMHSKLGIFVHYSLFNTVSEWYVREPINEECKETLKPHRKFLDDVCKELEKCSSGDLVLPPTINRIDHKNP